ncbi:MAG: hypothetical protein WC781_00065 [Candidatus Pacearchaeota archaeon]|jgi:hypothetical protein
MQRKKQQPKEQKSNQNEINLLIGIYHPARHSPFKIARRFEEEKYEVSFVTGYPDKTKEIESERLFDLFSHLDSSEIRIREVSKRVAEAINDVMIINFSPEMIVNGKYLCEYAASHGITKVRDCDPLDKQSLAHLVNYLEKKC